MIRIPDASHIGPALAQIRKSRGAPRQEVAFAVGMWASQYGQYELGVKVPHVDNLIRIAHALGYDLALIPREDS